MSENTNEATRDTSSIGDVVTFPFGSITERLDSDESVLIVFTESHYLGCDNPFFVQAGTCAEIIGYELAVAETDLDGHETVHGFERYFFMVKFPANKSREERIARYFAGEGFLGIEEEYMPSLIQYVARLEETVDTTLESPSQSILNI